MEITVFIGTLFLAHSFVLKIFVAMGKISSQKKLIIRIKVEHHTKTDNEKVG